MENQTPTKGIMLNYGLYLGITSILISLSIWAAGLLLSMGWLAGVLGFVAMVTFIVLGIKKFKTNNNNLLSFGQALKVGVGIAVVSALLAVVYNLIFTNFIAPEFQEQAMEVQRLAWQEANMTSEQIDAAEEIAKKFSSPAITSAISIVASAFFGFVISAIAGAIMKRSQED